MRRKSRSIAATVVALTALAVAGLFVPTASAAPDRTLVFVTQPQDSEAGTTIRAADLNQASSFVQVKMVDANGDLVTNTGNSKATFSLQTGSGFASGNLSVTAQPFVGGIATFGDGTLSIGTPNEPFFTSYSLVPSTTGGGPKLSGPASDPFDIFEDGESCTDSCEATIRSGNEDYSVPVVGTGTTTLGASQISDSTLPGFGCEGQNEIFANSVFVHVTTETNETDGFEPVLLVSHVTRQDMKKATNNGQAHIKWCLGLKTNVPWLNNGASSVQQDTNGDGTLDLWVAFAPNCPQANPSNFAPCIVSQNGDGNGGSVTTGYVPGGDPPRRT